MYIISSKLIAAANRLNITAADYGCSFVAKPNLEKKNFFWKNICVFTKYTFFAEKTVFNEKEILLEKIFLTEKNYISFQKYMFTHKYLCYK